MIPKNRNEIVILYDAQNANPNGDPQSANNMPRVDEDTREAIVTDVRLKRYIRDQLEDEGEKIYIRNAQRKGDVAGSRDDLFEDLFEDDINEIVEDENRNIFEEFLDAAIDVRYFGGTLSFGEQMKSALDDVHTPQYTGPLQFSHGRTLNRVIANDESKKLTTVVTSGGDSEQGTFAEDNRLEYALVRFHGILNENAAESTKLTQEDVERLDKTVWKAIKNQTLTRSKMGHNPQMYLRVEFEGSYHDGQLHETITLDDEESEIHSEMRSINDTVIDVSELLDRMSEMPVKSVTVKAGKYTTFTDGDEEFSTDGLYERIEEYSGVSVDVPEIYNSK